MSDAELSEDRVNRAHLDSSPPCAIADLRGLEVVVAVGGDEREDCEARDDCLLRTRPMKALKDLLVDESGRNNEIAACQSSLEGTDLGKGRGAIATHCKRPDARVDEEGHLRERSRL